MISNEKEYYVVGFSQWGRWQVRKSSVDTPDSWTIVEDLGPSLRAAYLEADGDFQYLAGMEHVSLITESVPWLFVITTSGKLYVKKVAKPLETAILLDTDVLQASVCRGWCSEQFDVDAGLMVAYRKETGAYLRVYRIINDTYTWDAIETLTDQAVSHIEIKRLNDFRIGILLDDSLLISERYYIGGTAKSEFFHVACDTDFQVMSFTQEDGEKADLSIVSVELRNSIEFWVRCNYPFYSRDENWNDITAISTLVPGQGIDRYYIEEGYLKIRMLLPITTMLGYMQFKIRRDNRIRFERTSQSRPICPELTITYEAPPIPYSGEHFDVQSTGSLSVSFIQPKHFQVEHEPIFDVDTLGLMSISMIEVEDLSQTYKDHFDVQATGSMTNFIVELVGDKPI